MRIEDLPPWAQAQAANQIMARQRRGSGRSRAPSPALSDDEEEMPRRAASKYHNRKAARITAAGNILEFDSQKEALTLEAKESTRTRIGFSRMEARRYDELALLLAAEKIRDLKLQPEYTLQEAYTTLEGVRVRAIRYRADFSYERATEPDCCGEVHWLRVVEDVKSEATRVYAIKRKLMRERLGIDVREV